MTIKPPAPIGKAGRTVYPQPSVGQKDPGGIAIGNKNKARANLRPEEFEKLVAQHGHYVRWSKAMPCPCVSGDSGQANMSCSECDGGGFVYIDEMEIQIVMMSHDKKVSLYEKFGLWQSGSAQVTTYARHRPAYRDAIEMVDAIMVRTELIKKGDRRGIKQGLPADTDAARYKIKSISAILTTDSFGNTARLEEGTDFTIGADGLLHWTPAGNIKAPDGNILSLRYDYSPVYLVQSWPHALRDFVGNRKSTVDKIESLPVSAMVQLDFIVSPTSAIPGAT